MGGQVGGLAGGRGKLTIMISGGRWLLGMPAARQTVGEQAGGQAGMQPGWRIHSTGVSRSYCALPTRSTLFSLHRGIP